MTKAEMVLLYNYDAWATAEQLSVISKISADQYEKNLGSSYGGIQGTLTHIYGAQKLWLARWTGAAPVSIAAQLLEFAGLRDRWAGLHRELKDFVETQTDDRLREPLAYTDLAGRPSVQPLWQQLQHVANHSTYHRGQITMMFRQLGVTPVATDLIAYYRKL